MKTFKQWLNEVKMTSETHSIIDGLNRGKHALMNGHKTIPSVVISKKHIDHLKLSPERSAELDKKAEEARRNGDYFSHSTFGDEHGNRWSVQEVLDHVKSKPVRDVPTAGFVSDQVNQHWQGNIERAKKAIPSEDHPIVILRH